MAAHPEVPTEGRHDGRRKYTGCCKRSSLALTSSKRVEAHILLIRGHKVILDIDLAMLSSVLGSKRAVLFNVEIMPALVRLRQILAAHADLERRLNDPEANYDAKFKVVFEAIRQLMEPPAKPRKPIGFSTPSKAQRP